MSERKKRLAWGTAISSISIICTFTFSHLFEFFDLSSFCSYELSSNIAYEWYNYIHINLSNETIHLITFIKNQSNDQNEIDCIMNNETICSHK